MSHIVLTERETAATVMAERYVLFADNFSAPNCRIGAPVHTTV